MEIRHGHNLATLTLFTGPYFRRTISELQIKKTYRHLFKLNGSTLLPSREVLLERKLFKSQKFEGPSNEDVSPGIPGSAQGKLARFYGFGRTEQDVQVVL
jgi:hypothetical protein